MINIYESNVVENYKIDLILSEGGIRSHAIAMARTFMGETQNTYTVDRLSCAKFFQIDFQIRCNKTYFILVPPFKGGKSYLNPKGSGKSSEKGLLFSQLE